MATVCGNDGNGAALGEALFGAARGARHIVHCVIGRASGVASSPMGCLSRVSQDWVPKLDTCRLTPTGRAATAEASVAWSVRKRDGHLRATARRLCNLAGRPASPSLLAGNRSLPISSLQLHAKAIRQHGLSSPRPDERWRSGLQVSSTFSTRK